VSLLSLLACNAEVETIPQGSDTRATVTLPFRILDELELSPLRHVGGVWISGDTVVAWSGTSNVIVEHVRGRHRVMHAPTTSRILTASLIRGSQLLVVEQSPGRCMRFTRDGKVAADRVLEPVGHTIVSAVLQEDSLFTLSASREGSYQLAARQACDGTRRLLASWQARSPTQAAFAPSLLEVSRGLALVSEREWPFPFLLIETSTGSVSRQSLPASATDAIRFWSSSRRTRWVAGPLLHTNDGFVISLTDLNSDMRMVVALSRDWQMRSIGSFAYPLGIVAADRDNDIWYAVTHDSQPKLLILTNDMSGVALPVRRAGP
jgi:hypothetical protein